VDDPNPTDARELISEILASGKTLYYIAKLMRRQYTQVKRMQESGRCQPLEYAMLEMIVEDVQRETLQNVTKSSFTGEQSVV
jgi:hypothetical protein